MKLKINKLLTLFTIVCLLLGSTITGFAEEVGGTTNQGVITLHTGKHDLKDITFNVYRLLNATTTTVQNPDTTSSEELVAYEINEQFNKFFTETLKLNESDANNDSLDVIATEYVRLNAKNSDFQSALKKYIDDNSGTVTAVETLNYDDATKTCKSQPLPYGHYVIVPSTSNSAPISISMSLVTLHTAEQNVYLKGLQPSVDKTVGDNQKNSSAQIGEEVTFTVKSTVPNMAGYDTYIFKLEDKLSKGLTFNKDSVEVTVGGKTLTKDAVTNGFTVSEPSISPEGETSFVIEITNFIQHKDYANQEITFKYSAVLNKDAVINGTGNSNEANVKYGNDPLNLEGPKDPSVATVYTHQLEITKTDENDVALSGAVFKIYNTTVDGTKGNVLEFVKESTDQSGSNTYRVATEEDKNTQGSTNVVEEVISGTNGKIVLKGLKATKYIIEETKAPDGYNKLKQPLKHEITFDGQNANNTTLSVQNRKGTLLPETGGMGTVLFTVVGVAGILAVAYSFRPKKNK